ncbi:DeoR family transcriptional regulator [Burkholderia multivorans]|uniref:DeoR/GlpR family DNA-binding transcription regulator n=1 Tax=Burkholderia multivorans TaxID=87883 RepID=UPI00075B409A|nr:DeoR/GlpR family DNA-binding transcription regulator [Burkholderia multivorans]KVV28910.1 DeoR family transcriptional regulator [Burkholderia multivorans]MCO8430645.1 DeoR/GlpR family DNA-binding transcription regulator [Burkholderia multivorans]MCO8442497.1 DeoR/GlpR family DNA-binding transcription regulator [Burkholderia multivorans]MCO8548293.1 DeoR/GlpR family DNA-binding transcription regulator [Burkholderia multivorans]HEF5788065.1 DeoR/GlpR transcriptional regulator [Burkholderia mu
MVSCSFVQHQDISCRSMLTTQRKKLILDRLARDGQVHAGELSVEFGISEDTVRRDLRELASEGLLQRVHGGALPVSPALAPFELRRDIESDAKQRIARQAASMIAPGQTAIIDGGTTSAWLAKALPADLCATIVTHSPTVATALAGHPSVEIILIGGRLYKHSIVAVGAAAMEGISRIHADWYFMGVTGVHPTAGLSTGDFEEAAIKRALAARAAETVVLASSSKLNAASPFVIGEITLAQTIVVEKSADRELLKQIETAGVTVVRA